MDHVRAVEVQERGANYRLTAWELDCEGFIMRWIEREEIDHQRYRIDYRQLRGDLAEWQGYWQLEPLTGETCRVILSVQFDIGIPMLSDMLDPVAERAIRDSSRKMLISLASVAVEKQNVVEPG
jgi:ribosome-associated toxin RatA of RatAB toxin-antitoxin module